MFILVNLKKNASILACILIFGLLELSCKDLIKPKQICAVPPVSEIRDILPSPSQNLATDIYFDSTLSMQGFITSGNDSYYQQTIAALERPIISSGGKVNFFEFGTSNTNSKTNKNLSEDTVRELSGRSYREANTKDFYSDPTKDTLIQNALEKADSSHLTVVITDLFQDQTDIDLLSRQIREKFIKENFSVGVFAIKSQFQGKIYDVGRNNYQSLDYVNGESVDTYRPFYILAFGKHTDIANYFSELADTEISSNQEKHIIIFSRYLTDKLPSISEVETLDIRGLNEVNSVLVADSGNNSNYKEFNIIKGSDSSFYKTAIPFNSLPNIVRYEQIKPFVDSCQCQNNQIQFDQSPAQPSVNNSNINEGNENTNKKPSSNSEALEINVQFNDGNNPNNNENSSPEGSTGNTNKTANTLGAEQVLPSKNANNSGNLKGIDLNVKVLPEKLESNTIHCFRVSLRAEKYSLPNWVSQWNLTEQEIEIWHKNQTPILGKTYNLVPFLQTILNSTVEEHKPKVAEFYFYIKQN